MALDKDDCRHIQAFVGGAPPTITEAWLHF